MTASPVKKPRLNTHGRLGLLGLAPPPHDPLPPIPPRLAAVLALLDPPARLEVRVRGVTAFRTWIASAPRGWRAVYYEGPEPLAGGRLHDAVAGALADEALKQSNARDVPVRSQCRHIRGRMTGLDRVTIHTENLPFGQGSRCFAVRTGGQPC